MFELKISGSGKVLARSSVLMDVVRLRDLIISEQVEICSDEDYQGTIVWPNFLNPSIYFLDFYQCRKSGTYIEHVPRQQLESRSKSCSLFSPFFAHFSNMPPLVSKKVNNKICQTDGGGLFVNVRKGFRFLEKWRNISLPVKSERTIDFQVFKKKWHSFLIKGIFVSLQRRRV